MATTADGMFYHVSRHRLPNRHGDDHYTQYGWYENSFRRTADGWKISKLKHCFQWCDGNPTLIDLSDPEWQVAAAAVFGPGLPPVKRRERATVREWTFVAASRSRRITERADTVMTASDTASDAKRLRSSASFRGCAGAGRRIPA